MNKTLVILKTATPAPRPGGLVMVTEPYTEFVIIIVMHKMLDDIKKNTLKIII